MTVPKAIGAHSIAPDLPRGVALLRDPALNKGTAFTERERDALGLRGLLPLHVLSQDEQVRRALDSIRRLDHPVRPGSARRYKRPERLL